MNFDMKIISVLFEYHMTITLQKVLQGRISFLGPTLLFYILTTTTTTTFE